MEDRMYAYMDRVAMNAMERIGQWLEIKTGKNCFWFAECLNVISFVPIATACIWGWNSRPEMLYTFFLSGSLFLLATVLVQLNIERCYRYFLQCSHEEVFGLHDRKAIKNPFRELSNQRKFYYTHVPLITVFLAFLFYARGVPLLCALLFSVSFGIDVVVVYLMSSNPLKPTPPSIS